MNVITISKEPIMINQDGIEIVAAYSPSDDIQKIIEDAEKLQAESFVIGDIREFGDDQQQFSILTQLQAHRGLIVFSDQSEYKSIRMIDRLNNVGVSFLVSLVSIFEYVMIDKNGMLHIFNAILAENDFVVEETIYSRDDLKYFVKEDYPIYEIRKHLPINRYIYNDKQHIEKLIRSLLAYTLVDSEELMKECLLKYVDEGKVPVPNAMELIPIYEEVIKIIEKK